MSKEIKTIKEIFGLIMMHEVRFLFEIDLIDHVFTTFLSL